MELKPHLHWISFPAGVTAIVLLLLAGPLPATGQEPISLSADSLMQFERVRIHLSSASTLRFSGRVTDTENDTLGFESDAEGRMEVVHDQIHRLQVMVDDGNPRRGFLLGAAIGGAVGGLGTFLVFSGGNAEQTSFAFEAGIRFGAPIGAVIGGLIGLVSAQPSWRDVELRP